MLNFEPPNQPKTPKAIFDKDVRRISDEHRSDGRATNDDQLRRLHQDLEVPVLHQIPTCHSAEDYQNADDRKHRGLFVCPLVRHIEPKRMLMQRESQ